MQPISHKYVPYVPKEFKFVEEKHDWNKLISTIENNLDLLMTEEGESLLFLAALQFTENNNLEAAAFLENAFSLCKEHKIPLDINRSPSEGPHKGKSVFWLLSYRYFQACRNQSIQSYYFMGSEEEAGSNDHKSGNETILTQDLMIDCLSFHCNVNAAPKEGPFTGVTAYGMLIVDHELITHPSFYSKIICDSPLPQMANYVPKSTVIGSLLSIIYQIESDAKSFRKRVNSQMEEMFESEEYYFDEEIQQVLDNCYRSLFKIIEDNPHCEVHVELNSNPLSPRQKKLLLFCIIAGAKIPEDSCNEILKKLNSVFDKVSNVYKYNPLERELPSELWLSIALNVILTEFPDLQNFSPLFLLHKFARGFK